MGELFLSPVGLSQITKLSIPRLVSFMMAVWFLSSAIAQYVGSLDGDEIVSWFRSVMIPKRTSGIGQDYFPEQIGRQTFYDPPDRGFEREIRKRLDYWARLRKERGGSAA